MFVRILLRNQLALSGNECSNEYGLPRRERCLLDLLTTALATARQPLAYRKMID